MNPYRSLRILPALLLCAVPVLAHADPVADFPEKPVKIVVGFPAGGSSDLSARIVAERMSAEWKTPVIVENRVGAGGTIAAANVAAAAPDGYTLLLIGPGTHGVTAAMYPNLSYEPVKSFAAISQIGRGPYLILVPADSKLQTMQDLIALAKTAPDAVSFASTGKGSGSHYVGESIARATGTKWLHVPYGGSAPATVAVMGGQVTISISDMTSAANVRSGKLRALAATTPARTPILPNVPTLKELGIPVDYTVSVGLVAAAGTPAPVIAKIHDAVAEALADDGARQKLEGLGFEAKADTPEEFSAIVAGDVKKFAAFVDEAGLRQQQ